MKMLSIRFLKHICDLIIYYVAMWNPVFLYSFDLLLKTYFLNVFLCGFENNLSHTVEILDIEWQPVSACDNTELLLKTCVFLYKYFPIFRSMYKPRFCASVEPVISWLVTAGDIYSAVSAAAIVSCSAKSGHDGRRRKVSTVIGCTETAAQVVPEEVAVI